MDSTRQNPRLQQDSQPGLIAKLAAFILSAAFLVLAFMFSVAALAIVAVLGTVLGGWLWWKTRRLRQQMRQMRASQPMAGEQVIEGEFVREAGGKTGGDQQSADQRNLGLSEPRL